MAKILDACCGSRMFWFDKDNPTVTYMDNRNYYEKLDSGHIIDVAPDVLADFRDMPFKDNTYDLVVFDPPHLIHAGSKLWMAKKYGVLDPDTWQEDLSMGFDECMRVLKPNGTLVFKWADIQVSTRQILDSIKYKPLFGQKRQKTQWLVFIKDNADYLR